MNTIFSKKILTIIILGLLSPTVHAVEKKECNSSDNLQGWGIWCGVDTYLTQQEPTAAGPVDGNNPELGSPALDSDKFGGSVVVPQKDNPYNWQGYAILRVPLQLDNPTGEQQPTRHNTPQYKYLTGILNINHDPENDNVMAVMKLEDGSTVTFDKNASFTAPAWDNSYFKITSEDESLSVVSSTLPSWLSFLGGSQLPDAENNKDVTSGYFTTQDDSRFPYESKFVAGALTNPSYINELALNNISATYSGYGMYKGDKAGTLYNQISVNFGNSSWNGHWNLDGSRGIFGPDNKLNASGVVTGNQFSSTEGSLNYQSFKKEGRFFDRHWVENNQAATGSIVGSFNGSEAKNLTGLVDVNIDGKRTVGVFANEMKESSVGLPNLDN